MTNGQMAVIPPGEDIRKKREQKGLTQNALAKLAGVSHTTISHWEAGKITPLRETAKRIVDTLNNMEDFPELK